MANDVENTKESSALSEEEKWGQNLFEFSNLHQKNNFHVPRTLGTKLVIKKFIIFRLILSFFRKKSQVLVGFHT